MTCLLWSHYRNPLGYGMLRVGQHSRLAHRVAYCDANGLTLDDIQGLVVRHKCDNPTCFNPEHLEIGTHLDNARDKVERGRQPKGENGGRSKLTADQVNEIRQRYKPRCKVNGTRALAKEFNMSNAAMSCVINGKTYEG